MAVKEPDLDEEIDEEEETKPPAAKKKAARQEDTPEWAKTIIKLLTPAAQPPEAKIIPAPKPPAKAKEGEGDQENLEAMEQKKQEEPPKQTFLGWFW